jgi:hypothetical protein
MRPKPSSGNADLCAVPLCFSCVHKQNVEDGIIYCDTGRVLQKRRKCDDYKKHKRILPGFSPLAVQMFWAPLAVKILAGIIAGVAGTLLVQFLMRQPGPPSIPVQFP